MEQLREKQKEWEPRKKGIYFPACLDFSSYYYRLNDGIRGAPGQVFCENQECRKDGLCRNRYKPHDEVREKQLDIFKETSKNFAMEVSATLLPSVTSLVKHLNKLLVKFENLSPKTKKTIGTVAALTAVFAPLAIGLGAVFKAISLTTSYHGFRSVVSFVAKSPFTFFKNARLEGTKTNKVLKGIGKGFKWTGKLAWGGVKKTGSAIKIFGKGIGKAFKWTGKLVWSGVKKTGSLIKIFGKGIGKAFKWTGKLAWSGVKAAVGDYCLR